MKMPSVSLLILLLATPLSLADDWPQWMGPKRDGIWRETGLLKSFPESGPKVKWRVPVRSGYAGPAVAGGRIFMMDWKTEAKPKEGGMPKLPGTERVVCFNEADGKLLWQHEYEATYKISYPNGPRTTPLVEEDRVYTLGAMGKLLCLNSKNGDVIWSKDLMKEYKISDPLVWGWSAHPMIDGDKLICLVGGKNAGVVAFDKKSGKELWRSLNAKEICYAPPVVHQKGDLRQLIVWYDVAVAGMNIQTGEILWTVPFPENGNPQRPAVAISHPRVFGDHVFVSQFYDGAMVLKLTFDPPDADVVWISPKDTGNHKDTINILMAPAIVVDEHIYGMAGNGELRCLKALTGEVVWRTPGPTGKRPALFATTFIIPNEDRYFMFNDQGELILAELSPKGYEEKSRFKLLEATSFARGRDIVWSHPAFANKRMYARNDKEVICVELSNGSENN
ncbi:MAG: PQQ-binding-like beta-propeller repeat protein [Planctomycetota bacterium]